MPTIKLKKIITNIIRLEIGPRTNNSSPHDNKYYTDSHQDLNNDVKGLLNHETFRYYRTKSELMVKLSHQCIMRDNNLNNQE